MPSKILIDNILGGRFDMNREALTNATMSALQNEMNNKRTVRPNDKTTNYKKQLKKLSEDYANDFMNLMLGFIPEEDLYNLLNANNNATEEIIFLEQK